MSAGLKNAVITGANRGIGLEICRQLAESNVYGSIYAICRKTSPELTLLASNENNNEVKILENIEITKDDGIVSLKSIFSTNHNDESLSPTMVPIHLLIHNAGDYGPREDFKDASELYASQNVENITADRMRFTYDLNTIAPLMITQALLPNLVCAAKTSDPSKVIIVSSVIGSIAENTSGKHYAYRAAKAAVNMVGKSLSVDLKDRNIAVALVHPGYVYTGFGFGGAKDRLPGQRDVDESARGVIEAINKTNMENSGTFWHGNYGEGIHPLPW